MTTQPQLFSTTLRKRAAPAPGSFEAGAAIVSAMSNPPYRNPPAI